MYTILTIGDEETNFEHNPRKKEEKQVCCMVIASLSFNSHEGCAPSTIDTPCHCLESSLQAKRNARELVLYSCYIYIYRVTFQPLQRLSRLPFERFRARLYFAAKLLKSRVVLPLRCACLFRFRRCGIFLPLFLCL